MTDNQILNYDIAYQNNNYQCQCGKSAVQVGHRIANTKINRKKYGNKIIDNYRNLVPVCGLECNSKYNIGNKPLICEKLVKLIKEDGKLSTKNITAYLGK